MGAYGPHTGIVRPGGRAGQKRSTLACMVNAVGAGAARVHSTGPHLAGNFAYDAYRLLCP